MTFAYAKGMPPLCGAKPRRSEATAGLIYLANHVPRYQSRTLPQTELLIYANGTYYYFKQIRLAHRYISLHRTPL